MQNFSYNSKKKHVTKSSQLKNDPLELEVPLLRAYSRVRNKYTPKFIIFGIFFRGYGLTITELKVLNFTTFQAFFLSNFPEPTFIQGATSIPDSYIIFSSCVEGKNASIIFASIKILQSFFVFFLNYFFKNLIIVAPTFILDTYPGKFALLRFSYL